MILQVIKESPDNGTSYMTCMSREAGVARHKLFCEGAESERMLGVLLRFIQKWLCEGAEYESRSASYEVWCHVAGFIKSHTSSIFSLFNKAFCGGGGRVRRSHTNQEHDDFIETELLNEELVKWINSVNNQEEIADFTTGSETSQTVRLTKRQYDLWSMMSFLRQIVCNKTVFIQTVTWVDTEYNTDQMSELAPILHGFICCTVRAVH